MNTIIVISLPRVFGCSVEVLNYFGYNFFYGNENIEAQWRSLESLRERGGVIIVAPDAHSAIRELLDPYIGEDGFLKEDGYKTVRTKGHGDFKILLFSHEIKSSELESLIKGDG